MPLIPFRFPPTPTLILVRNIPCASERSARPLYLHCSLSQSWPGGERVSFSNVFLCLSTFNISHTASAQGGRNEKRDLAHLLREPLADKHPNWTIKICSKRLLDLVLGLHMILYNLSSLKVNANWAD